MVKEIEDLSEENFKKLQHAEYDLDAEKNENEQNLKLAYDNITELLKKYCDLNQDHYPIIATWIIGTYFHENYRSYPYLFLNAMRGSGKSRTLKLITDLSKGGEMQMSMTEAVLFRTKGTLGIDEFESIGRRGNENLRELLNSAYKKGTKVKRMKQKKSLEGGMEQVVEEFDVYRPIVMANIWGMEEVLGDRCITLVIEKSNNPQIVKLQEIWEDEEIFIKTKEILESVYMLRCDVIQNVYSGWNNYVITNPVTSPQSPHIHTYTHIHTQQHISLYNHLNLMNLDGRSVEMCFPLFLVSFEIGVDVFEELSKVMEKYFNEKKEDQFAESRDVSFIDYVSQEVETKWMYVKEVTQNFKDFLQYEPNKDNDWLNPQWVGQALKRLKLRKEYKRERGGVKIILDTEKAQVRIKMFK